MKDEDFLELFSQIRTIRSRIEAIEGTQEVLVRAQARDILPQLQEAFAVDALAGRVYLEVDGNKSQSDIVAALSAAGHASSPASVSRKLEKLEQDLHLVVLADRTKAGKIYRKAQIERILNLSRIVEKWLGA
jgi:hypothetical protein